MLPGTYLADSHGDADLGVHDVKWTSDHWSVELAVLSKVVHDIGACKQRPTSSNRSQTYFSSVSKS